MEPNLIFVVVGALLFVVIAAGLVTSRRRERELRETAMKLGLDYRAHDRELAAELARTVPLFAGGRMSCAHVTSASNTYGELYMFHCFYADPKTIRRRERRVLGLVACLRVHGEPVAGRIPAGRIEALAESWHLEHAENWLVARSVRDRERYDAQQMRDYYAEVQRLLDDLFAGAWS
jgi:hypothetical protein